MRQKSRSLILGDKELARKLFVELSHDHLGIPGNGALVILDGLDDDVSAKTEQQLAADEGVGGSPVYTSRKKPPNGDHDSEASDATQVTDDSAASNGSP